MNLEKEERYELNRARFARKTVFFIVPKRYDYNSVNDSLICSTIAAAFYPKILAKDHKGWRNIVNNQQIGVARNSINRRSPYPWLSYYHILQSHKFYDAHEISKVDDIALALLCGDAEYKVCGKFLHHLSILMIA